MDFITDLPTSEGNDSIFVIVYILKKYSHFISIPSKEKARKFADSYVNNIFLRSMGFPRLLLVRGTPNLQENSRKNCSTKLELH